MKKNIIVILGATATGKSDLAVQIARKINGEIISADSRQVYKGLDIGTGKITKQEMKGVPHHLLDVISPKKTFSVNQWKELAEKSIADIISRGKIPIIVGGTGFYIQSIVDNIVLPEVPPNLALRKKLEKKSVKELFTLLKKIDSRRAKDIDQKNSIRLIRAIEIATQLDKVPQLKRQKNKYDFIQIGLTADPEVLRKRISIRLFARIREGMIAEAKKLYENGLSYKRMRSLGLEYRYLADFLEKKISRTELIAILDKEIYQYAKRQMTWFKRDKRIYWMNIDDKKFKEKVFGILEID